MRARARRLPGAGLPGGAALPVAVAAADGHPPRRDGRGTGYALARSGGCAMHDLVIRGGRIVDGTGRPAFAGDVAAIAGGRLVQVGGKAGPGRREPGRKADVNVIDFGRLRLRHPAKVHDLPAGGKRLVQRLDGYDLTLVSGMPVCKRGEETGARPGRLVRAVAGA